MIQRLSHSLLAALAALALVGTGAPAADPAPAAKGGKDATAKPAAGDKKGDQQKVQEVTEDTTKGLGAMCSILPMGQKNLDVKIPSFHDGKPSSFVHAASMVRVDDDHMNLEGTDIFIYGEKDPDTLHLHLITGQYNMGTQVLVSHQRSRVSRADFQLEGDRMVFDTKSQQGKMEGNVEMIIHDISAFKSGLSPSPKPDQKSQSPEANAGGVAKGKP